LWEWKTDITFAPRKYGKFLEILREELEKKRFKNFGKKTLIFSCRKQKEFLVLHPL
jgi:hypothetical protein